MQHELLNDIYKPAGAAGPLRDSSSTQCDERLLHAFIISIYLYVVSSAQVIKCLFGNDDAAATAALDWLLKERLIKSIATDQQQSGQLIKLTPSGADYAEAVLGQVRGSKYDSTSRFNRKSILRHDLSSQLYACRMKNRHGDLRYMPEAAMPASKKTKYFDIIMMSNSGRIVGVEIERTSKYDKELASSMARAIRAIRAGAVDFVVFVLPTTAAVDRYDRVLDADSFVAYRKTGRRWVQDGVIALTSEDLMRIVCVVGSSTIWKGAL